MKRILFLSTILALVAAAGRIIMGRRSGDEDEAEPARAAQPGLIGSARTQASGHPGAGSLCHPSGWSRLPSIDAGLLAAIVEPRIARGH